MATCPECGGSLSPVALLCDPGGSAICRWCRAQIALHPVARVARNVLLLGGGALLACACALAFLHTRDLIWLVAGVAGLLATALLTIAWILVTPLVVLVPRGALKPWSRPRPPRDGSSRPADPPAPR